MSEIKKRNSAFELVKIFCILGIVVSHYITHGVGEVRFNEFSFVNLFMDIANIGDICSGLFLFLSGYFLCSSKHFSFSKFFKILFAVLFYSLFFCALAFLMDRKISISLLYESLFSLFCERTWFVGCYLIIYLFHPFINKMLCSLSIKNRKIFFFLMVAWTSFILLLPKSTYFVNRIISAFSIYSMGALLSFMKGSKYFSKRIGIIGFVISVSLLILSAVCIRLVALKLNFLSSEANYLFYRTSPIAISLYIFLTILCETSEPFFSKTINTISSCSLGVYLIHDNSDWVRNLLWNKIIKPLNFYPDLTIKHLFISCILIFIVCVLIEFLRKLLFEKLIFERKKIQDIFKHLDYDVD